MKEYSNRNVMTLVDEETPPLSDMDKKFVLVKERDDLVYIDCIIFNDPRRLECCCLKIHC